MGLLGPASAAMDLRIGLTPVFLDDRTEFLLRWRAYLQGRLSDGVRFVQRKTYREVVDLLLAGELDAAWICGFPFVRNRDRLRLLAVPLFEGQPLYRSYLIVPAADQATRDISDLRGKVFAYSDPDSNSGYLVPRAHLLQGGADPDRYFARAFFAWSHRDVVRAVAERLADAGAVDGYVWETLARIHPELTGQTRVVRRSEQFGFPPLVASPDLAEQRFRDLRRVLLNMSSDPAGATLLNELNLDGFIAGDPSLFEGIARLVAATGGR